MFDTLKTALIGKDRIRVCYECRRCGANLEGEDDSCPYCGPSDVSRFAI